MSTPAKILWGTKNPSYSTAHKILYLSKRVCDCTWGARWTIAKKLIIDLTPAACRERVEAVAKAIRCNPPTYLSDAQWCEFWDNRARAALSALSPKLVNKEKR